MILAGLALLFLSQGGQPPPPPSTLTEPPAQIQKVNKPDWEKIGTEGLTRALVKLTNLEPARAKDVVRTVERETLKYEIHPLRVLAFIVAESWGNPRARSRAGARGLMQIMPGTGRYIASSRREKWRGVGSLYDIETNISYGVWYYHHLLEIFAGNERAAVAAYNWGPEHIARRLETGRPLPQVYPGKVFKAQAELEEEFSREATLLFWEGLTEQE